MLWTVAQQKNKAVIRFSPGSCGITPRGREDDVGIVYCFQVRFPLTFCTSQYVTYMEETVKDIVHMGKSLFDAFPIRVFTSLRTTQICIPANKGI